MGLRSLATSLLGRARSSALPASPPPLPLTAWFDQPDAASTIDDHARTDADRRILESWVRDGYAIVERLVPHHLIDDMLADLDSLFVGDATLDDLAINDLVHDDGHRALTHHRDLMVLDPPVRLAMRDRSSWRIHGFYRRSDAADRVRQLPEMQLIASTILGVESRATYSINFHNGSTQTLHEDSAVFHLGVPNMICGAWIACEDVVEGSGPLLYYPGSHRRPMFERFDNYPFTNLRTAPPEVTTAYRQHVETAAAAFEPHTFLARKGDVLFWHGMLAHGGEPIRTPGTTRRSYVLHFIPAGADVADQITGPTNW